MTAERETGLMHLEAGFPRRLSSKEPARQSRRHSRHALDPWSGRSPGEGHGNHSSILTWKIPWTEGKIPQTVHEVSKELDMT